MSFLVPQNLDVEDTIFFGLSIKQVVYLGGAAGLGIGTLLYLPTIISIIIVTPVGIFALLLSFYRHNNRPFAEILQAIIQYSFSDKMYVWKQGQNMSDNLKVRVRDPLKISSTRREAKKIDELSSTIDI